MSAVHALLRSGHLRTIDHALAMTLLRLRPQTTDAVALAAALASRAVGQGHSLLPLSRVAELLAELVADADVPVLPRLDEWLAALRACPWVNADSHEDVPAALVLDGENIALRRYWSYEVRLAETILTRCPSGETPAMMAELESRLVETRLGQLFPALADRDQADAARAAISHRLLLLTGGPGTGKTTTVARTLVLFAETFANTFVRSVDSRLGPGALPSTIADDSELAATSISLSPTRPEHWPRIILAAPTGKAAARLAEAVRESLADLVRQGLISEAFARALPGEASTLHRLLGWRSGSIEFHHHAGNPLAADLVVVDEASMIDLPLMCKLLEAIAPTATLVLVGDRDQLPSVETGDVLAALCDAAQAPASPGPTRVTPAPATTAPSRRCIPRVHLIHTHRQNDDVDVSALAALVRDGDADTALAGMAVDQFRGVHWQRGHDRGLADAVLAAALPTFRQMAAAPDVATALTQARQWRVLTAVREGPAGSTTLNNLIAGALAPARHRGFFQGQLVMVTQNSYRHGLFNGDIGIAWPDSHAAFGPEPALRIWFETQTGLRAWSPATLPGHESAFALTVHKSQGSEFDSVLLVLPEYDSRVLSRELLYTGLTRCRRAVTLWAGETVLRQAIARRAQRWSGLAGKLQRRDRPALDGA